MENAMMRPKASSAMARALRKTSCVFMLVFALCIFNETVVCAASCEKVVGHLNAGLSRPIDEKELVEMLRRLNATGNKTLPDKFITKKEALALGWNLEKISGRLRFCAARASAGTGSATMSGGCRISTGGKRIWTIREVAGEASAWSFPPMDSA